MDCVPRQADCVSRRLIQRDQERGGLAGAGLRLAGDVAARRAQSAGSCAWIGVHRTKPASRDALGDCGNEIERIEAQARKDVSHVIELMIDLCIARLGACGTCKRQADQLKNGPKTRIARDRAPEPQIQSFLNH